MKMIPGGCCYRGYPPPQKKKKKKKQKKKINLMSYVTKSCLCINYFSDAHWIWILHKACYVQNFKMIGELKWMWWMNKISSDLILRWVSEGYPIYYNSPQGGFYPPGPWVNIKMSSYQYRKSHCGDKTVVRSSYLHNGISYTGKITSLYWIKALAAFVQCPIKFLSIVIWSYDFSRNWLASRYDM